MNHKPTFGFVLEYVTDIAAAKRFYVEVLGLEVQRDHPVFVQFNQFAIASDESLSGSGDPEVYWLVENAEAAFQDISPQAEVIQPIKHMPFGKVFAIKDPAGRPLYLVELSANRPSRPVN